MFTLPPRSQLIFASCVALIFAIPIVTLVSSFVIFPILFYGALAIFVNLGLLVLPIAIGLNRVGLAVNFQPLWHKWVLCGIIWAGCAFGFARWGDSGGAIGARNLPYLEVLFFPILMALGYRIG